MESFALEADAKSAVVMLALHGGPQANGAVQRFLEEMDVPFTGPSWQSAYLCGNQVSPSQSPCSSPWSRPLSAALLIQAHLGHHPRPPSRRSPSRVSATSMHNRPPDCMLPVRSRCAQKAPGIRVLCILKMPLPRWARRR